MPKENKISQEIRKELAQIILNGTPQVARWLQQCASHSPDRAIYAYCALLEYVLPKLGKLDVSHEHTHNHELKIQSLQEVRQRIDAILQKASAVKALPKE